MARHHKAHLIEVARVVNAMTDEQRERLGIVRHEPAQTYDRVDRTFTKLTAVLDAGHHGVDVKWLSNRMAQAAVPEEFRQSRSIAVDGTDVETWGALHGDAVTVELDGEATETQLMDTDAVPKPRKPAPARKAKVFGTGADGRNVYTADADARAGHRSATNSRAAGPYVGYELHLAVQARDVKWTNYVDKVTMSDEVPGVITCFALTPAGTHRAGRSSTTWSLPSTAARRSTTSSGTPATRCARPAPPTTSSPSQGLEMSHILSTATSWAISASWQVGRCTVLGVGRTWLKALAAMLYASSLITILVGFHALQQTTSLFGTQDDAVRCEDSRRDPEVVRDEYPVAVLDVVLQSSECIAGCLGDMAHFEMRCSSRLQGRGLYGVTGAGFDEAERFLCGSERVFW